MTDFYADILRNLEIFVKLLWQVSVKVFRNVLRNDKGVMTYINHLTETMCPINHTTEINISCDVSKLTLI